MSDNLPFCQGVRPYFVVFTMRSVNIVVVNSSDVKTLVVNSPDVNIVVVNSAHELI